MSKDVSILQDGVKLNYRTAMLIYYEDKVLLQKAKNENFWNMPGGRVKFGEDSLSAIKREMEEELEIEFNQPKFVGFFENFFEYASTRYHELLTVYSCQVSQCELTQRQDFDATDNPNILYHWFNKKEVKDINCLPEIIYDIVDKNDDKIVHDITKKG